MYARIVEQAVASGDTKAAYIQGNSTPCDAVARESRWHRHLRRLVPPPMSRVGNLSENRMAAQREPGVNSARSSIRNAGGHAHRQRGIQEVLRPREISARQALYDIVAHRHRVASRLGGRRCTLRGGAGPRLWQGALDSLQQSTCERQRYLAPGNSSCYW